MGKSNSVVELHLQQVECQIIEMQSQLNSMKSILAQLEGMIEDVPNESWTPKSGDWIVNILGSVMAEVELLIKSNATTVVEFGLTRSSRHKAEEAAKSIRIHNRLLAYRDEFDAGYQWDYGGDNAMIYYNMDEKVYQYCNHPVVYMPGGVYMSRRVAEELVKKLNNGSVVL